MKTAIHCFKPYDIRGRIPDQLNDDIAYRIGRAYALWLKPKNVVVGYDIRLTSDPSWPTETRSSPPSSTACPTDESSP
jgi:phosphomannomutase